MFCACYEREMTESPEANDSMAQVNEVPNPQLNTEWKLEND